MFKFLNKHLGLRILLAFFALSAVSCSQGESAPSQNPLTEKEMGTLIKIYPEVVRAIKSNNYAEVEKLAEDNGLTTERLLFINTKAMLLWAAVRGDDPEMKNALNIDGQYAFTPEEEELVKKYSAEYANMLAKAFNFSKE